MVRETTLTPNNFILPLFIHSAENIQAEISSMPGQYQWSVDRLSAEVEKIAELGITAVILFTAVVAAMGVAFSTDLITLRATIPEMHTNLMHWGVYVSCFGIMLIFSCGTILSYRGLMNKVFRDENEELYEQFEDTMGRANSFQVKAEVMRLEFNQIFNAIDDGLWIIGNDKKVLHINASLMAFLNVENEADAIGRKCHELITSDIC